MCVYVCVGVCVCVCVYVCVGVCVCVCVYVCVVQVLKFIIKYSYVKKFS